MNDAGRFFFRDEVHPSAGERDTFGVLFFDL